MAREKKKALKSLPRDEADSIDWKVRVSLLSKEAVKWSRIYCHQFLVRVRYVRETELFLSLYVEFSHMTGVTSCKMTNFLTSALLFNKRPEEEIRTYELRKLLRTLCCFMFILWGMVSELLIQYVQQCTGRGGLVAKALRYKPADRGFDSRWCHWNFSVT